MPDNDVLHLAGFSRWDALSEKYFPKPNGTPRARRSRNALAHRHGIKLAVIGHVAYAKEADVVRALERQTTGEPPRGRGRPRKVAGGSEPSAPQALAASQK